MNTKNCINCYYHKKGKCTIDKHDIEIDLLRAYSCKYYKIINKILTEDKENDKIVIRRRYDI